MFGNQQITYFDKLLVRMNVKPVVNMKLHIIGLSFLMKNFKMYKIQKRGHINR